MNKTVLRTLARMTVTGGEVNEAVREYVLRALSKPDLKKYLFYLRGEIAADRVRVRVPDPPDEETRRTVEEVFAGKTVTYETDVGIGAGFQIEYRDNVLNVNMKNVIERTIERIKESL